MTTEEELIVNRLKATYADVDEMQKVFNIVTKTLALREAELSVTKSLLGRAADALDRATKMLRTDSESNLIAELRKAAQ